MDSNKSDQKCITQLLNIKTIQTTAFLQCKNYSQLVKAVVLKLVQALIPSKDNIWIQKEGMHYQIMKIAKQDCLTNLQDLECIISTWLAPQDPVNSKYFIYFSKPFSDFGYIWFNYHLFFFYFVVYFNFIFVVFIC
jgi:hypothetical protein